MSAKPQRRMTPEEYLAMDRAADFRSEYYAGRVYAMSGGSWIHARIISNVSRRLANALDGRNCDVCSSDMRVQVGPDFYTYPDVVVVCGEPKFPDARTDIVLNPMLIIEILSPSTERYDRGFKASHYRKMPSLRELVIVAQEEPSVEIYRRQPSNEWLLSEAVGLDSTCRFDSVECTIPTAHIYERVTFDVSFPDDRVPN
jgi:Uma2 family endonuclease